MNSKKGFLTGREGRNAAWLIGGKMAQMALSLVVGVLTARFLGPGNYGLVNYGAALVGLFTSLCTLGLNAVLVKDLVDDPRGQGATLGTALGMRVLSGLLSAAMCCAVAVVLDGDDSLTVAVVAACSLGLVFQAFDTFNYWFQSRYRSKVTAVAGLVAYVAISVYRVVLLALGADVVWFALATSVDYAVLAVFLYAAYRREGGPRLSFSLTRARSLISRGYHYILSGMVVAIYGQTDKFMLMQMAGDEAVGLYSTATTICGMWVFVLSAVIDSVNPTIMRLHGIDGDEYIRKNVQLYRMVFYVSAAVSFVLTAGAPLVVGLLYGEAYLGAVAPLRVVTWYTAFSYLGVARNAWVVCEGKQRYLKYMYGAAAVMNVVLNLALIPLLGTVGAALASLATQAFTSIVLPFMIPAMRPNAKLILRAIFFR